MGEESGTEVGGRVRHASRDVGAIWPLTPMSDRGSPGPMLQLKDAIPTCFLRRSGGGITGMRWRGFEGVEFGSLALLFSTSLNKKNNCT